MIKKISFVLVAMLALCSCNNDEDSTYNSAELVGIWQKEYDDGIADAGVVRYTFHPQTTNSGTVDIFTSDWATGDTTVYRNYTLTDTGILQILPKPDDHSEALTIYCQIHTLTSTRMTWHNAETNEELTRFKKIGF